MLSYTGAPKSEVLLMQKLKSALQRSQELTRILSLKPTSLNQDFFLPTFYLPSPYNFVFSIMQEGRSTLSNFVNGVKNSRDNQDSLLVRALVS